MKKFFQVLKSGFQDFLNDDCMVSGAALAYYTVFSLPPLLVLVFFIAGLFNVSQDTINDIVRRQVGLPTTAQSQGEGAEAGATEGEDSQQTAALSSLAQRQTEKAQSGGGLGPISKMIGIAILIFSATTVFAQLQQSLNRAWEVEPDPEQGGWKNFIVKRSLSLGMIVVIAFLLLVSLVFTTMIEEIVRAVIGESPGTVGLVIGFVVNTGISLAMATVLFALMYKILPDAKMRWKDTWMGAFITAVLFVVGKELIGWYLQNSQIGSAWGSAAASMVALLVWVYYSSLIVLLGAELAQAWANQYGKGIEPTKGAVRVVEEKVHHREEEAGDPA